MIDADGWTRVCKQTRVTGLLRVRFEFLGMSSDGAPVVRVNRSVICRDSGKWAAFSNDHILQPALTSLEILEQLRVLAHNEYLHECDEHFEVEDRDTIRVPFHPHQDQA